MGRKKSELSEAEKEKICNAYLSGMKTELLEKKLKHSMRIIRVVLEDCGIPRRKKIYNRKYYATSNDTKCWSCKRAAAPVCVQCPWALSFTPVDGWNAKQTVKRSTASGEEIISFLVKDCPLYLPD